MYMDAARTLRQAIITGLLINAVAGAGLAARAADETARDVLERLQVKYNTAEDATITFTQTVKFTLTNATQTLGGTLVMKKPNYTRFSNEQQTIVTDGTTVWSYSAPNKQVIIDSYRDDPHSFTPARFILGLPSDYYATLLGREKLHGTTVYVLKLVTKDNEASVRSLKMWVDPDEWVAWKIVITDVNETETTYQIKNAKFDTGVSESMFHFQAPKGATVVDLRKQR